ncbi:hypothetical protein ANTPLA_LOCUS5475 [Anthophora plagiata]
MPSLHPRDVNEEGNRDRKSSRVEDPRNRIVDPKLDDAATAEKTTNTLKNNIRATIREIILTTCRKSVGKGFTLLLFFSFLFSFFFFFFFL